MLIEFLKLVILLGTAVKAGLARLWLALALALGILYLCVGLAAASIFEVPWPGMAALVGAPVDLDRAMMLVAGEALAAAAVTTYGWRRFEDGSARREASDLFALTTLISLGQIGVVYLL